VSSSEHNKIAVVLIVKDEYTEIVSWISWYLSLGVDTIFIYDDNSDDDTYDIVKEISMFADIRLQTLNQDSRSHTHRQRECYIDVLQSNVDHFDWIGFFDADEYLRLSPGITLKEFLIRDGSVGAVAVNWCNYGSGGHVLKPNDHPYVSYSYHFPNSEAIGRHVKSFVRPRAWTGVWYNVHYFDVGTLRYVDASGVDVIWSNTPGVTEHQPTWESAKIMHYQCRSMEHFVERMRKRPDLPRSTAIWLSYDINAIRDDVSNFETRRATDVLRTLVSPAILGAFASLCQMHHLGGKTVPESVITSRDQKGILSRKLTGTDFLPSPDSMRVSRVTSNDRNVLRYCRDTGHIIADTQCPSESDQVYAISFASADRRVFLTTLDFDGVFQLEGDVRVSSMRAFQAERHVANSFSFLNLNTRQFISAPPSIHGGVAVCNRIKAADWEKFELDILGKDTHPHSHILNQIQRFRENEDIEVNSSHQEIQSFILKILPVVMHYSNVQVRHNFESTIEHILRYIT
jgi:hypothetical protein